MPSRLPSSAEAKAQQLVGGGAATPLLVPGKGAVEGIFLADRADVALTYCSGAPAVTREVPGLETVPLPLELTVGPAYGMVLLNAQARGGNQAKWRGPQHCPILPLMAHSRGAGRRPAGSAH